MLMVRVRTLLRNLSPGALHRRLQERAFALLYGRGARVYDRFTTWLFLGEWAAWQETALPLLPATGPILELGCGTGRLASRGHTETRLWLGLDSSPYMLTVARRRIRPTGPQFLRGDARRLPFASGSIAAVVATFPTSYILDPAVAAGIARVLKPGGHLVVVLHGELASEGWQRRWRQFALRWFYGGDGRRDEPALVLPGFDATRRRVGTAHGLADVYVLEPSSGRQKG